MPTELSQKHCEPCRGTTPTVDGARCQELLPENWTLDESSRSISRRFEFKNFHRTMAFVNAVAWIAHQEDHHPDMAVGYRYCRVSFSTHAIDGLSLNDFICAAKVDELVA